MSVKRGKKRCLSDAYSFDGFRPVDKVRGIFGKPKARILPLIRRSKKQSAVNVAPCTEDGMTASSRGYEIYPTGIRTCIWKLNTGVWTAGNVEQ